MTVSELIKELSKFPQDASVGYLWDGSMRSYADEVYLSKSGYVVICEEGEEAYCDDNDMPADSK